MLWWQRVGVQRVFHAGFATISFFFRQALVTNLACIYFGYSDIYLVNFGKSNIVGFILDNLKIPVSVISSS